MSVICYQLSVIGVDTHALFTKKGKKQKRVFVFHSLILSCPFLPFAFCLLLQHRYQADLFRIRRIACVELVKTALSDDHQQVVTECNDVVSLQVIEVR